MAFIVPGLLCSIGLLLFAFRGWLWLRVPAKRLCPGPRLKWKQRAWPLWIVYRPRCGYDLSGHALNAGSTITCPECGRGVAHHKEMIRTVRALRPAHLGCVFIAAGLLVYEYPPLTAMTIVEYTPTEILLEGEGVLGIGTPLEVRGEIRRRAMDHQLRDDQICRFVRLLVNDLHDDAMVDNAGEALHQLTIFGVFCMTPLVEAIDSEDQQQRRFAVSLLQRMPGMDEAPDSLLQASIMDLRADERMYNAKRSFAFLIRWANHPNAQRLLNDAMRSDDAQQRLLCAAAAGCASNRELADAATPILVSHLADNQVQGDAIIAARAIWGFGAAALPLLEPYRASTDEQQRQSVEYIVQRMTTSRSIADLQQAFPRARLTRARVDAMALEPEYLDMPEF